VAPLRLTQVGEATSAAVAPRAVRMPGAVAAAPERAAWAELACPAPASRPAEEPARRAPAGAFPPDAAGCLPGAALRGLPKPEAAAAKGAGPRRLGAPPPPTGPRGRRPGRSRCSCRLMRRASRWTLPSMGERAGWSDRVHLAVSEDGTQEAALVRRQLNRNGPQTTRMTEFQCPWVTV
jgi:hypothetical protein